MRRGLLCFKVPEEFAVRHPSALFGKGLTYIEGKLSVCALVLPFASLPSVPWCFADLLDIAAFRSSSRACAVPSPKEYLKLSRCVHAKHIRQRLRWLTRNQASSACATYVRYKVHLPVSRSCRGQPWLYLQALLWPLGQVSI